MTYIYLPVQYLIIVPGQTPWLVLYVFYSGGFDRWLRWYSLCNKCRTVCLNCVTLSFYTVEWNSPKTIFRVTFPSQHVLGPFQDFLSFSLSQHSHVEICSAQQQNNHICCWRLHAPQGLILIFSLVIWSCHVHIVLNENDSDQVNKCSCISFS